MTPKLLRLPRAFLSHLLASVCHMKREAAEQSLPYRVACCFRLSLARSMSFPASVRSRVSRGGCRFQQCAAQLLLFATARLYSALLGSSLHDGVVGGRVAGWGGGGGEGREGEFHVIVPGVRFCTVGRLFGAALPTTTAAIMCG
jgi:hypothetical protein